MPSSKPNRTPVIDNRRARRDYHVLDKMEAGLVLTGTEVKSVRLSHVTLTGGYIHVDNGEAWLHDVHIQPYEYGNTFNHPTVRKRKLLLHKREIEQLHAAESRKGRTLIPLKMYFKRGRAKLEIGICKGKQSHDKRDDIKKRDSDREAQRAMRDRNR